MKLDLVMRVLVRIQAKERVEALITSAVEQGATLLLDGRDCNVEGYPNGNFVGPTIIGEKHSRYRVNLCASASASAPDFLAHAVPIGYPHRT